MNTFPSFGCGTIIDGYSLSHAPHVIRSDMESGPARVRRTSVMRNDRLSVRWALTAAEFWTFREWFVSSAGANYGAAWFTISLQTGQASDGSLSTEAARFAGPWTATMNQQGQWVVRADLEVQDTPIGGPVDPGFSANAFYVDDGAGSYQPFYVDDGVGSYEVFEVYPS